jgi:quercetin dioxygenase-like cupin family protein
MRRLVGLASMLVVVFMTGTSVGQQAGVVKPEPLLEEVVHGMPTSDAQKIRVMTASFKPGDRTVFHTHPLPVTVYVLQGEFTLELEGRKPTVLKAGQAFVEPPHVKMTGFNRSATEALRVVIFYVSDTETPFLELVH